MPTRQAKPRTKSRSAKSVSAKSRATKPRATKPRATKSRPRFADVLEAVDQLTVEEQEELTHIVRRRVAQRGRERVIRDVREARKELAAGRARAMTPAEIMTEIMS